MPHAPPASAPAYPRPCSPASSASHHDDLEPRTGPDSSQRRDRVLARPGAGRPLQHVLNDAAAPSLFPLALSREYRREPIRPGTDRSSQPCRNPHSSTVANAVDAPECHARVVSVWSRKVTARRTSTMDGGTRDRLGLSTPATATSPPRPGPRRDPARAGRGQRVEAPAGPALPTSRGPAGGAAPTALDSKVRAEAHRA